MSACRIECYTHSDAATPNKGGAMIRITAQTDFATRGDAFQAFARRAARMAYAAQSESWADVAEAFPDLEADRAALAASLRETVEIDRIVILTAAS